MTDDITHGSDESDFAYDDDCGFETEFPEALRIAAKSQAAAYSSAELESMTSALSRLLLLSQQDDPLQGVEWVSGRALFRTFKVSTDAYGTHWNASDAEMLRGIESRNQEAVRDAIRALSQVGKVTTYTGSSGPYARNTFPLGRSGLRVVVDKGWLLAVFADVVPEDDAEDRARHDTWVLSAALMDPFWRARGRG